MPSYFRSTFDRENLKRGKALLNDRFRVGGIDIHFDNRRETGVSGATSTLSFDLTRAEVRRSDPSSLRLDLDRSDMLGISKFFASLASDTLSEPQYQAMHQTNWALGTPFLDPADHAYQVGHYLDTVVEAMTSLDLNGMRALSAIAQILERGDAIRAIEIATRDQVKAEGVNFCVRPDTATAGIPVAEQARVFDQITIVIPDSPDDPPEGDGPSVPVH